jgi:hypothetical protein
MRKSDGSLAACFHELDGRKAVGTDGVNKAGAMRPLGISNFEDKLVLGVMHQVLESIYEPLFMNRYFCPDPMDSDRDAAVTMMSGT